MTAIPTSVSLLARGLAYRLPDGRTLFTGLDLAQSRERTAVVGSNGSGKSTLLTLLQGARPLQSGEILRRGVHLALSQSWSPIEHPQVVDLLGVRTPLEALTRLEEGSGTPADADRAAGWWDLPQRLSEVLDRVGLAGLDPWRSSPTLSGGEVTRAALAGLLLREPDLLLLDEPTNHLDAPSRKALRGWLSEWKGGVILATHDRSLLEVVDRVLELGTSAPHGWAAGQAVGASSRPPDAVEGPHHQLVAGGLAEWTAVRALREGAARRAWEQAEEERSRKNRQAREVAQRQVRRGAVGKRAAGNENQAKILKGARDRRAQVTTGRALHRLGEVREAADHEVQVARARVAPEERITFRPEPVCVPAGREVVRVEGAGVEGRLHPVSFRLTGGARLAVHGANGAGKTTLLHLLVGGFTPGGLTPTEGRVHISVPPSEVALLRQDLPPEPGPSTVLDRMRDAWPEFPEHQVRQILAAFLFSGEAVERPLGQLSGGERVRLELARLLGRPKPPALLLLDEPTNHLDLSGVEAVEEVLQAYRGTLVVVSHDAHFLGRLDLEEELHLLPSVP